MKQILLALGLIGVALGANAALYLRTDKGAEAVTGASRVTLGGKVLNVPRALIRDRAQMAGGRLDRLDLALAPATLGALAQPSPLEAEARLPDHLALVIAPQSGEPGSADLFQNVYARFLARETWSNPGGLVMRRFRPGTPYEDRELYLGVGGKKSFVALCPLEALRETEPCTTSFRQDGLDIEMRFNARHLPDWRRLTAAAGDLVAGLPVKSP